MDKLLEVVGWLNSKILWGWPTIILLLGTGVYFTFAMGFIQVRKIGQAFKETFGPMFEKKERKPGEVSPFQSLATAIAAQVGTGNLAGVASAIAGGGPGAIFWMWISGFFGMGTIFAEAVVAQRFVKDVDGQKIGGPAYYIRYGLKNQALGKFLAGFFAIAIILALGLMGNVVQANAIAGAANTAFGVPPMVVGIGVSFLVLLIVVGGVSRITSFTEKIVPFMALLYIVGSFTIIFKNASNIGPAFSMIFNCAFSAQALAGGAIGVTVKHAVRMGFARGLFSNEAGMGSTPHAHALAAVKHPGQQGLVATIGVFIDTIVICTTTALVILTTNTYIDNAAGLANDSIAGSGLTQLAFTAGFGEFGTKFISISLFFFAFSTIVGWYFFGETNVRYLFGKNGVWPFRVLVVAFLVVGSSFKSDIVWELADMFNALMVIPNLIALLALSGLVVKIKNDYEKNFLKGGQCEYLNENK